MLLTNNMGYKRQITDDLEMVEQLGSGVPRILKAYSKDNFTFMEHFIRMNFPALEPVYDEDSRKSSVKIVNLIGENNYITIPEMAEKLELSTRAVEKQIAKLKEEGILKRVGPDKGGHWEIIEK